MEFSLDCAILYICHDLAKQLSQYLFFFSFNLVSYSGMCEILARVRASIVYK